MARWCATTRTTAERSDGSAPGALRSAKLHGGRCDATVGRGRLRQAGVLPHSHVFAGARCPDAVAGTTTSLGQNSRHRWRLLCGGGRAPVASGSPALSHPGYAGVRRGSAGRRGERLAVLGLLWLQRTVGAFTSCESQPDRRRALYQAADDWEPRQPGALNAVVSRHRATTSASSDCEDHSYLHVGSERLVRGGRRLCHRERGETTPQAG
mmetsp:Transcript_36605/g.80187  ORF Transcript_36605/g.80187 Transcript_36605/m.80187 type:complete len:210 (-) Transcript_36605:773-1402(-)